MQQFFLTFKFLRDVILVYLLGDTQKFLKRIQIYLKTKQKLIEVPPASLLVHHEPLKTEIEELLQELENAEN